MEYKGYRGTIEDDVDGGLFGRVLGTPEGHTIVCEGANLDELRADFEAAIDTYMSDCQALGFIKYGLNF